jgi:AraC-like DNA-binding protein
VFCRILVSYRCNLSELVTTDTELIAMAAAAIIGLSLPAAATGIEMTL